MPAYVLVPLYLVLPALILLLCRRFPALEKVGVVLLCYLAGLVLGNVGLVGEDQEATQSSLTEVCVALALPLLLFGADFAAWVRRAGKALVAFVLAVISVLLTATLGVRLIEASVPEAWKLGGLAVAVYTGGTPNMAAVASALKVDSNLFLRLLTYDTLVGFLYVSFCVSLAQRFFRLYLRPSPSGPGHDTVSRAGGAPEKPGEGSRGTEPALPEGLATEGSSDYAGIFSRRTLPGLLVALGLAALLAGLGFVAGQLVPAEYSTPTAILTLSALGLAASFVRPLRRIEKTFPAGMYAVYVFCVVVASMARVSALLNVDWPLFGFVALCTFGTLALHSVFAKIFRIDTDTFIITSVATICSPPFVPVVAAGLKNRAVLLSGISTGILGYALANFLAVAFAYLVR